LFTCEDCGTTFPLTDGTVRMLADGFGASGEDRLKTRTGESFGYEWEHFGELREEWQKNFRDYLQPHDPAALRGQLLLDVGTGSGRHSRQAHEAGAAVVAVDVGRSIDTARRNLPPDVLTVQADAERLPFRPGTFDVVMSIGVLHHLPDTERAFRRLVPLAREGGIVHVYLYWVPPRRGHQRALRVVDLARRVTTRLPHRVLHPLCYPIAAGLFASCVIPYRVARRRPRLARLAAAFPLKAYADYPFAVCVNDQFDRFSAPVERRFTKDEVRRLFVSAGLEDVTVLPNNGWVASGRRPAASGLR
jgi:SAM-dependent methyltransferase